MNRNHWLRLVSALFVLLLILLSPLVVANLFYGFYREHPHGVSWVGVNYISSIISGICTAFGVLAVSWAFFGRVKDDRAYREDKTHAELNARYAEYLSLVVRYPDLPIQDFGDDEYWMKKVFDESYVEDNSKKLDDLSYIDYKRTVTVYEILYTMMERAYLTYAAHNDNFKKKQWYGWDEYIKEWFERSDFRTIWERHLSSSENDSDFTRYIAHEVLRKE
jgi:hypothetical protein